jgi:hypothetical protein
MLTHFAADPLAQPHCEATKLHFRLSRGGQADPWLPSSVTYSYEDQPRTVTGRAMSKAMSSWIRWP